MIASVYYEVHGPRPIYQELKEGGVTRTGVTVDKHVRFASLSQAEANGYATDIWKHESIVCEVFEVDRHAQAGHAA